MSHIEFSYTLTEEEVFEGLKYSGIYKTSGKRAVIETSVLAVLFLFFLISFLYNKEFFNLVMGLITLGVVLGVTKRNSMPIPHRAAERFPFRERR